MTFLSTIDCLKACTRFAFGGISFWGGLFLMCGAAGCGSDVGQMIPTGGVVDGNQDGSLTSSLGKTAGEPNDAFSQPVVAVFDANRMARLQGTVATMGDLDVFLLGALSPGDQVIVDTFATGDSLDVSVALFDDRQRLVYNNDDRGGSSARFLDSFVEWIARYAGNSYYLVVTHSAFAGNGHYTGSYRVDVEVTGGFPVPQPAGQILVLDFDGGDVDAPTLGSITLEPFDAGSIARIYHGQTGTIKETIRAVFEQNFERFNVTIVTTDDPPLPSGTEVSTIYFGGFNPGAFGVSEGVDLYNVDFCDDALIFTESFDPRIFFNIPTAEEVGVAIGNVGSHEAGHLLGLNHVDDDRALMDDRSAPDVLLEDQEFMDAPLSSDVMSIGTQDAVLLLDEIVGPLNRDSLKISHHGPRL